MADEEKKPTTRRRTSTPKKRTAKPRATKSETPVVEEAIEEPVVVEETAPEPEETVVEAFGDSAEEIGKAQVTAEVGHNECPYCGCVDVLTPAGIAQSEELHEYRCAMCGKIHGFNTVEKVVAWTV